MEILMYLYDRSIPGEDEPEEAFYPISINGMALALKIPMATLYGDVKVLRKYDLVELIQHQKPETFEYYGVFAITDEGRTFVESELGIRKE
jgi:hypothetical protein